MSDVTFSPQILPEQLPEIKAQGFASIINNRPDHEELNQPLAEEIQKAAEAIDMSYAYIPVVGGQMTQSDVEEFAKAYNEMPKPVFMFCRSGNRSSVLHQAAKQLNLLNE